MAINPESQYPGKIAPSDADYPYGSARNITTPGDGTGTPWEAALVNDVFGFQQALLDRANIVPTGTPDKVGASQYLDALLVAAGRKVADYAAVRALTSAQFTDGDVIFVTNDNVFGPYVVKTGTLIDNNGGYIVFTDDANRYAERAFSGWLFSEWFEAVGDGVADDSTEITNLVTYRNIVDSEIYLTGVYNVDQTTADLILAVDGSKIKGFGAIIDPNGNRIPLGRDYNGRSLSTTRPVPDATAFAWLDILPTVHGVGNVDASESAVSYAERIHSGLIGSGLLYVDPVNGSDAGTGSIAQPLETISEAVRIRPESRIILLGSNDPNNPVVFRKFDFRDTDVPGNKIKIITARGHCVVEEDGDDLTTLTWTSLGGGTPSVYASPVLGGAVPPRAVFWTKYQDTNGGPLRIPEFTSVADVNSSGFGWYFDGSALNVRIQGQNVETIKSELGVVYADATSRCLYLGTKISMEAELNGSLIFNGVQLTPLVSGATRAELFTGAGVKINYAFGHGVDALGAFTVLEEIEVFAARLDNLHYTDSGGVECRAVEINCISHEAGDVVTRGVLAAGTDNGSAMHANGYIARYAGKYFNNYGPDVVDSSAGQYWNVGSEAFGSSLPANAFGFDVVGGTMWLDTCHARDEDQADIRVEANSTMRLFNTSYRTLTTAGGTSIVADFDPLVPE